MIIRALLLLGLAAIGWLVFVRRNRLPFHILFIFTLLGVGAAAVLAPERVLDDIARAFGVGRGVDLITYIFEVVAAFVLLHYYTKFVELQRQLTTVTRELAILKAEVDKARELSPE
jgi:small membrane protein